MYIFYFIYFFPHYPRNFVTFYFSFKQEKNAQIKDLFESHDKLVEKNIFLADKSRKLNRLYVEKLCTSNEKSAPDEIILK